MKYYSYFFLRLVFILAAILCLIMPCSADDYVGFEIDGVGYGAYISGDGESAVALYAVVSGCEDDLSGYVNIPSTVDVPYWYYDDNGFNEISLNAPVTAILDVAFYSCDITGISIPNTITEIGEKAFYGCRKLKSVVIPNSVTEIKEETFSFCESMTSVVIPGSVNSIGYNAFYKCSSLTTVTIPNSVTTIGSDAFLGCSGLTNVALSNSITTISYGMFMDCSSLTSVTIPNSVSSIRDYAFSGCSGLTSVIIPNSVTEIRYAAFEKCRSLTSIDIPEGVTKIMAHAFEDCTALARVNIPNSITGIGDWAFSRCRGLRDIYCAILDPTRFPELSILIFNGVPKSSCVLHVPPGTENLYRDTYPWVGFLINGTMITSFHKGLHRYYAGKTPFGVTADGVSRMYIYFDNNVSKVTSCNVKMTIDGEVITDKSITGDLGEIKVLPNGRYGFDYCAPEVFNNEFSNRNSYEVNIEAEIFVESGSSIMGTATVTVMRPGVLLLHGLFSDSNCFKELTDYLLSSGGYESYQVLNGNYKKSNSESFHSNTYVREVVYGHLDQLFRQLAEQGIISSKYDLVGHSMGGILSRKYAQEVNAGSVNRIITLDTPHSGSQLATIYRPLMNWIQNTAVATVFSNPVLSIALSAFHLYLDNSRFAAIEDLLPSGSGIAKLNNPDMLARAAGIPVHAVVSYMYQGTHAEPESCVEKAELLDGMSVLYYLECEETQVQDNDFGFRLWYKLYKDENDGIVPLESQMGGLTEPNITLKSDTYRGIMGRKSNAFHCRTNHWNSTIENITDLLLCPKDNNYFSTDGFHPVDLSSTSMEKTVPDKPFKQASPSSFIQLNISPEDATRTLEVNVTPSSDIAHYIVFAFTDDDHILINGDVQETQFIIPDTYEGTLKVYALGRTVNDELVADIDSIDYTSVTSLLSLRYEVEQSITMSVGQSLSLNVIADWDNGQQQYVDPTFTTSDASIISINNQTLTAKGEGQCVLTATFKGMTCYKTINVIPGDFIVGDVNGDMEVNILDVDAIIGYILSSDSVVIPDVADVNSDGEVNIIDIDAVISIILNN